MPLIPGTTLTMDAAGVVDGTASSMALARGQAHAARTIAPALAAIDDAVADPSNPMDADAAADMKQAIVDAWNTVQAPLIIDDCAAICSHIITNLRMTFDETVQVQRLPQDDPPGSHTFNAFSFCSGPTSGVPVHVDGKFS